MDEQNPPRPGAGAWLEEALTLLQRRSVHDRAEGARRLGAHGGPQHLALLLDVARTDPSPAVRLCAAGSAGDVLGRHRLGSSRAAVSDALRQRVLDVFKGVDPGVNPGLFGTLGALGDVRALDRIFVGLRDPRHDVRKGAVVGLKRHVLSAQCQGDAVLEARVVELLDDPRLRPDALADLARVVASAGWRTAAPRLEALAAREDQVGQAAAQGLATLDALWAPDMVQGAWACDGRDAGEELAEVFRDDQGPRPERPPPTWWLVGHTGELLELPAGDPSRLRGGSLQWVGADVIVAWAGQAPERLPFRPLVVLVGPDRESQAIQVGERTFTRGDPAAVGGLAEELASSAASDPVLAATTLSVLEPSLPENARGLRVATLLKVAAGRPLEAVDGVRAALEGRKKPAADLWFVLGEALSATGDEAGALAAYADYLERAPKGPFAARARRRLGQDV